MTILTKPFEEKKSEKLLGVPSAPIDPNLVSADDLERASGNVELLASRNRRMSFYTTLFTLLAALLVMCIGIIGGVTLYRAFGRAQMARMRFHGFCGVPYDSNTVDNNAMIYMNNKWRDDQPQADQFTLLNSLEDEFRKLYNETMAQNFFKEEFELNTDDDDDEGYAKITVPDFRDGRNGRFLHDFKKNQSCIIDTDSNRCFVMPLDRDTVLPPKSMYDLLTKMWSGFYNIDTDVVRKDMRVVTPAVTDLSTIAPRINAECENMKIYWLEKITGNKVFKRDIQLDKNGMFAEFGGRKITEYDIINIAEVTAHENENH